MWAVYWNELQRRWYHLGMSMLFSGLLGSVLWATMRPESMAGVWSWALTGTGCALAVGLAWPLRPAWRRRRQAVGASASAHQGSALAALARRRQWAGLAFRLGVGAAVAVAVYAVVLGVHHALENRSGGGTAPVDPKPAVVQAADPKPAPEPLITIGDRILVCETEAEPLRP